MYKYTYTTITCPICKYELRLLQLAVERKERNEKAHDEWADEEADGAKKSETAQNRKQY